MATAADERRAILLRGDDNVAVAARPIPTGAVVHFDDGRAVEVREPILLGHKLAIADIDAGQPVRKYGQVIGFAARAIPAGSHVHTHNVKADLFERDYAHATEPAPPPPGSSPGRFPAILRPDGRVGTRNYIAVISTVNCSASTSKYIADRFRDGAWKRQFPNVDGVFAITHKGGCGLPFGGPDFQTLERVLAGFANHPNVAAYVIVGLGCEGGYASHLVESQDLVVLGGAGGREPAGRGPTAAPGAEHPGGGRHRPDGRGGRRGGLPAHARGERLASHRAAGLEAHPGPGVRRLRRQLGRHRQPGPRRRGRPARRPGRHGDPRRDDRDLRRRALADPPRRASGGRREAGRADQVVGVVHRALRRRDQQQPLAGQQGRRADDDLREVARGAGQGGKLAAGGRRFGYAERVDTPGLVFMDTPGYDPPCTTGLVAGGSNVLVFTTGRGSVLGLKPCPCIKVATNTPMYERMIDDMDLDAGTVLEGEPVESVGRRLFELILDVASGQTDQERGPGRRRGGVRPLASRADAVMGRMAECVSREPVWSLGARPS